jgi:hypothetical protein
MSRKEARVYKRFEVSVTRQGVGNFVLFASQPFVDELHFGLQLEHSPFPSDQQVCWTIDGVKV